MNYRVTPSSPTEELMTVGQTLAEIGGYASTVLDREHLAISRKCSTRLNKVVGELISRRTLLSSEGLHDIPPQAPAGSDLAAMTVSGLHSLYRRRSLRSIERGAAGRESFTFFLEGRIVRELRKRKASGRGDHLKIDYCLATYRNELDNMSALFSLPVEDGSRKIYPDCGRIYTPRELTAMIRLYKDYRDVAARELLVEYVDIALDLLEEADGETADLAMLTELAELGRRKTVRMPEWVVGKLQDAVKSASDDDPGLPLAMLTLQILTKESSLERKAQRLINRSWRAASDESEEIGRRVECLHTAVTCCDYVSRYSVRKAARLWNELSARLLSEEMLLTPPQIARLLEIARECEAYAPIDTTTKARLRQHLAALSASGNLEATALSAQLTA